MLVPLHLRSGTEDTFGDELVAYADEKALSAGMLTGARDLMCHDTIGGHLDPTLRIDAEDTAGAIVQTLRFEDRLTIARRQVNV
ncbi:hypothetical protein [uncultured Sphingomonas sp.]|uniref:hypothetical protein n=1 Tax=uncultured Sphingomonas sp. TaxID=158754 RepID=UPI0035CB90A0